MANRLYKVAMSLAQCRRRTHREDTMTTTQSVNLDPVPTTPAGWACAIVRDAIRCGALSSDDAARFLAAAGADPAAAMRDLDTYCRVRPALGHVGGRVRAEIRLRFGTPLERAAVVARARAFNESRYSDDEEDARSFAGGYGATWGRS